MHRAGKLGLGTAVVAGFGVATADIVGVMDADFSHPPALVPRMYAVFKATGADVAGGQPVCSRRQHAELAVQAPAAVAARLSAGAAALADPRRGVGLLPDPAVDRARA